MKRSRGGGPEWPARFGDATFSSRQLGRPFLDA